MVLSKGGGVMGFLGKRIERRKGNSCHFVVEKRWARTEVGMIGRSNDTIVRVGI